MKSNPYVYPYTPFADLSNKNFTSNFSSPRTISNTEFVALTKSLKQPEPKINGDTVADKILSIFLDPEIVFGDPELISSLHDYWVEHINHFVDQNKPIMFTLLGFPFKVPVPIKTNRTAPDMGEVLILARLHHLTQLIAKVYPTGAKFIVFTEGGLATTSGNTPEEAVAYHNRLIELTTLLGYSDTLEMRPLGDMEKSVPDFQERFEKKIEELKKLFDAGDEAFVKAYNGANESISRIVSTRGKELPLLMDVYNESLSDDKASEEVRAVRDDVKARAHIGVIRYHAYLRVRDDIEFLQKSVPDALALSVSPKPYRLGIQPISSRCIRLPYHSVPVYHKALSDFTMEYLVDIMREGNAYTPVHLEGDKDPAPFYYEVV